MEAPIGNAGPESAQVTMSTPPSIPLLGHDATPRTPRRPRTQTNAPCRASDVGTERSRRSKARAPNRWPGLGRQSGSIWTGCVQLSVGRPPVATRRVHSCGRCLGGVPGAAGNRASIRGTHAGERPNQPFPGARLAPRYLGASGLRLRFAHLGKRAVVGLVLSSLFTWILGPRRSLVRRALPDKLSSVAPQGVRTGLALARQTGAGAAGTLKDRNCA